MKLEYLNNERLRKVVQIYLNIAYQGVPVPEKVSELVELATRNDGEALVDNPHFEVERGSDVLRIFLRLGNRFYPHMKLGIVECAGLKEEFVLIADTHDKAFAAIAEAPDFGEFQQLQEKNACIKNTIESVWGARGFSTEAGILQSQSKTLKKSSRAQTTIMIVDDTPMTLNVEASILAHAGFQVLQCTSGYAAVEQAQKTRIDLCLMDIMMPGMDGYEAIQQIHETRRNSFPILIATAALECDVKKEVADGFISKPFSARLLVSTIESMLKDRKSM